MGSRGSSSGANKFTGIGVFSNAAFDAKNDARSGLIMAINRYNLNKGENELPIKKISDDGYWMTLGNNDKVPTRDMLDRLDIRMDMPKGWQVDKGATTAPRGLTWINNSKSRFGGEFKQAMIPTSFIKRSK